MEIARTVDAAGSVELHLAGDLDHAARPSLVQASDEIQALGARTVVVHLAKVTFLDSAGINWLLQLRSSVLNAGGTVRLAEPSDAVRRTLAVVGLTRLLGE